MTDRSNADSLMVIKTLEDYILSADVPLSQPSRTLIIMACPAKL